MKEESKWEVVWSNDKPLIVFRDYGVFKILKTKVEKVVELTAPLKDPLDETAYQKIRKTLCEDLDLDGRACDDIRALYHEFYQKK